MYHHQQRMNSGVPRPMNTIIQFFSDNGEWIFSGVGCAAIAFVLNFFRNKSGVQQSASTNSVVVNSGRDSEVNYARKDVEK